MSTHRRKWLIPCDYIAMCFCNASVPWCIVVMHHSRDALWCIITVMPHRYDVSTWRIKGVIRDWLYVTFYWYDACMMWRDTVWWMLMHDCWWTNDECWWWMLMDELWMNMNVDACWWMCDVYWMMYDALMNLWCVMQWCMLNRLMWVKCMHIFCNDNCILYCFCSCFNVLILICVCLSFRVMMIFIRLYLR